MYSWFCSHIKKYVPMITIRFIDSWIDRNKIILYVKGITSPVLPTTLYFVCLFHRKMKHNKEVNWELKRIPPFYLYVAVDNQHTCKKKTNSCRTQCADFRINIILKIALWEYVPWKLGFI